MISTKPVSKARKTAVALAVTATALTATTAASATPNDGGKLSVVAYSIARDAYGALIPAFQQTPAGQGTSFSQSFGASGDQARAVDRGSAGRRREPLAGARRRHAGQGRPRRPELEQEPVPRHGHELGRRVRRAQGQPQEHQDLGRPGQARHRVITPNPFTSGGARWNVMAAYGAQSASRARPTSRPRHYLAQLFKNVAVQDKSARDAAATPSSAARATSLIAYESEAISRRSAAKLPIDYVDPRADPADREPGRGDLEVQQRAEAKAFVTFLRSAPGRRRSGPSRATARSWRRCGTSSNFPTPKTLFTIDDLGGWTSVTTSSSTRRTAS